METELEKMLAYAGSCVGSSFWAGRCQGFVASCYYAGTGRFISRASAKEACDEFMRAGTADDLEPPAGAAVYFVGDGSRGKRYGHAALSLGDGQICDPVATVVRRKLTPDLHNGYLGWGWNGNIIPGGVFQKTVTAVKANAVSSNIVTVWNTSNAVRPEVRADNGTLAGPASDGACVLIGHGGRTVEPCIVDSVKISSFAGVSPSVLELAVIGLADGDVANGDAVSFSYGGKNVFYGYVFSIELQNGVTRIKGFDQLRYLKNRDTFAFAGKASELVTQIAGKYGLRLGTVEDTGYRLPQKVYDNTLADIISDALTATRERTGRAYRLYDDAGTLTLRSADIVGNNAWLDVNTMRSYKKTYSIDSGVYNRVVTVCDYGRYGVRSLYTVDSPDSEKRWGVLQYVKRIDQTKDPAETAKKLLKAYDREQICIYAYGCVGSTAVRGGSIVRFSENGRRYDAMRCESVKHVFFRGGHLMDLKMRYFTQEVT